MPFALETLALQCGQRTRPHLARSVSLAFGCSVATCRVSSASRELKPVQPGPRGHSLRD